MNLHIVEVSCRVCKQMMKLEVEKLPEDSEMAEIMDRIALLVTCDACMKRLGRAKPARRQDHGIP